MQSVRIEGANMSLGKPSDWNEAEHGVCFTLPVRREFKDGLWQMTSAWQPTPDELRRLIHGASIHLNIVGGAHPPVMLTVGEPPDEAGSNRPAPSPPITKG